METTIGDDLDLTVSFPADVTSASGNSEEGSIYYVVSEKLFVYLDPVLTAVGVVGNLLMLATVQRKALRSSPMSVFISALAVADTAVLILDFINNWLKMTLSVYLLAGSTSFCRFHRMFFTTCFTYAAWAVVAISVERFIVVWFPLRAKIICTRRNAVLTVTCLALPIAALNLYNFWTWHLDAENNCNIHPDHTHFLTYIVPWLNGALYSYVPVLTLIVTNAAIIFKLASRSKARKEMTNQTTPGSDVSSAEARITRTACVICLAYLLLTIPLSLFYVVQFAAGEFIHQGPVMALAEIIVLLLALANHATNFFLYLVTSASFRAELVAMVSCGYRRRAHGTGSGQSVSEVTGNTLDGSTASSKF